MSPILLAASLCCHFNAPLAWLRHCGPCRTLHSGPIQDGPHIFKGGSPGRGTFVFDRYHGGSRATGSGIALTLCPFLAQKGGLNMFYINARVVFASLFQAELNLCSASTWRVCVGLQSFGESVTLERQVSESSGVVGRYRQEAINKSPSDMVSRESPPASPLKTSF